VLFERLGQAGRITLNRPQALNALSHEMCRALHARLAEWARDDAVGLVIIDGAGGRAFCAGGDVRALYADWQAGGDARFRFYRDEYRLNAFIKRYPKPYVALIDGIVMGGGVGVSIHGSHRVATERTVFAMPETGIGLFPDVGGTYFLPRLPGELGLFLGLTGHRLKAADCLHAGLADAVVPSERLPDLIEALSGAVGGDAVTGLLRLFAEPPPPTSLPTSLPELRAEIDDCFGESSVERILSELEHRDTEFAHGTAEILRQKSPTSLKVTLRQLRAGAHLGFEDCMRLEYRLACRFMQAQDFFEGVRAVVIDKDNKPAWRPESLEAVSDEAVAAYFAPLPDGELTFD
jgi:enoyl-CoA hydratase